LNPIRVFALGYVILGHVVLTCMQFPLAFPQLVSSYIKSNGFYVVEGGFMAVDTFFWISALLMTYILLKKLNSE